MLKNVVGMHICNIYRDQEERLSISVTYILSGLELKERCVYIADKDIQDATLLRLEQAGIRPEKHIESGQLVFLTKDESYLLAGYFSPFRMIDQIEYSHYETLKKGYHGLRGAGQMSWALEKSPGSDKLVDYENQVNAIFPNKRMSALCAYDETKFPEDVLLDVLYTHPKVIIYTTLYDNPHYIPPEIFSKRQRDKYSPGDYQRIRDSIINTKMPS